MAIYNKSKQIHDNTTDLIFFSQSKPTALLIIRFITFPSSIIFISYNTITFKHNNNKKKSVLTRPIEIQRRSIPQRRHLDKSIGYSKQFDYRLFNDSSGWSVCGGPSVSAIERAHLDQEMGVNSQEEISPIRVREKHAVL